MAPELIRGAEAGPASDVYSLGCVVFECVAGTPPFAGKSLFEIGSAHVADEPPDPLEGRPDLPAGLSWAVLQALAKDPGDRPRTATMYAHMLRLAAKGYAGARLQRDPVERRDRRELVDRVARDAARDDANRRLREPRDERDDVLHQDLVELRPAMDLRAADELGALVDLVVHARDRRRPVASSARAASGVAPTRNGLPPLPMFAEANAVGEVARAVREVLRPRCADRERNAGGGVEDRRVERVRVVERTDAERRSRSPGASGLSAVASSSDAGEVGPREGADSLACPGVADAVAVRVVA